jgi:hypothetical protein
MADITILNFDKDGGLVGELPVVGAEITDVVLIAHGWNEGRASAVGHYQDLVAPLEVILSQNGAQWQGHTVAYFGVIWPSAQYADELTVINMRADVGDPPHAGIVAGLPTAPPLNDADLQARARDVAQFLGIDPDLLASQALRAAGDNGARDALVLTLQNAAALRQSLADEQTKAEYAAALNNTGSNLFSAIDHELQQLFTNVADVVVDNPLIGWLKQLRGDANTKIAHILNLFAYNEMKIRAGVVGSSLAKNVLNSMLADGKRIHLVSHSFGGRLMTAATAAAEGGKISNLILLEGAFSHNALSIDCVGPINGAFGSVIDNAKVAGRIAVAHSDHDAAVWIAYPLASRVFRDSYSLSLAASPLGQVLGGPTDRYGAIGANGPQNLVGVNRFVFTGTSLPNLKSGVHALDCTSFVASHSDVWKEGSAYLVAAGLLH